MKGTLQERNHCYVAESVPPCLIFLPPCFEHRKSQDPNFFHVVDVHVIEEVSSRWYKSVKKLVKHIEQVVETVPGYKLRHDLVMVRGIFVWVAENIE